MYFKPRGKYFKTYFSTNLQFSSKVGGDDGFDPAKYKADTIKWVNDKIIKEASKFKENYNKAVKKLEKDVKKVKLSETEDLTKKSVELRKGAWEGFAAIAKMEENAKEMMKVLSRVKFFIKQEYNAIKYKVHTSVASLSYPHFFGKANEVAAG